MIVHNEQGADEGPLQVTYTPIPVPLGPSLKVQPVWKGEAWQMTLDGQLTEFLGYADVGTVKAAANGAAPIDAKVPRPEFRVRQITAPVMAQVGDSLFLRLPSAEETERTGRKGWFARPVQKQVLKRLYLLIEIQEPAASPPP